MLSLAQMASAGPFEDGLAAYKRSDFANALKLLRPLAEEGNAQAQNQVGDLYYDGKGVAQDYKEAVRWYRMAADQGDSEGQKNLGVTYAEGHGVQLDYSEAVRWYRKAAEQGNASAQRALGSVYYRGTGVVPDYGEALKWFRKAAERGDPDAQMWLAVLYTNGKGVGQDYIRAYMWSNLVAGSALARNIREMTASKMTQAELSQAQALTRVCQQSNYKSCGEPEISPTENTDQTSTKPVSLPAKQGVSSSARSVPLTNIGGIYAVPVVINNAITLNFLVDSGAADVSIPADVVMTLIRTGTLSATDFIGTQVYQLADGSTTPSRTFRIRSLKVGDRGVENVMGSVASVRGELLLGQSFLRRFRSWSIDNTKHALVLE
jgi:predicted aspartyl protease